jgi:hypothetical protein
MTLAMAPDAPVNYRQPNERARQSDTYRRRAFALLVVAYLATIVDLTIVNVALPTIGRRLRLHRTLGVTALAVE